MGSGLASTPLSALAAETVTLPFDNGERPLIEYPQKRPLIRLTTRPPQLETPFAVYDGSTITPNDAFFVRYHLTQSPPADLDAKTHRVEVRGKVNTSLSLSMQDLRTAFEPMEIVAVNQCSGNGRGFSNPRVAGGQAGNGLMGNARWKGVPLKSVLDKAGVQEGARQVTFNGLDQPAISDVTVHVPAGRMQPIDSPMIFKGLAWRGGLPSDGVCDSLGTWNPKTNLT
jgi:sulfite dehydrogenase